VAVSRAVGGSGEKSGDARSALRFVPGEFFHDIAGAAAEEGEDGGGEVGPGWRAGDGRKSTARNVEWHRNSGRVWSL
jgi:hypothetical protein